MRTVRADSNDLDMAELVTRGSAGWTGPNPLARHSRWATGSLRRGDRDRAMKLVAAFAVFTALVFGSVTLVATGSAASGRNGVTRLMPSLFTSSTQAPPAQVPAPTSSTLTPGPGGSPPAAHLSPGGGSSLGANPRESEDPSPPPSPGRSASPMPSPRPSGSPDE